MFISTADEKVYSIQMHKPTTSDNKTALTNSGKTGNINCQTT